MEHILSAIDQDLAAITDEIVAMGDAVVVQVRGSVEAFAENDGVAAARIVEADKDIDARDVDIERRAVRFLALHQPMADDLRRPIAAMKTATQLERCGDLAKNIAKRVAGGEAVADPAQTKAVADLGALVVVRLAAVVEAYRTGDAKQAHDVWANDTDVDARHEAVVRRIIGAAPVDAAALTAFTHLLFIAKNLERIGDHATNVAELVHYQLTGQDLEDRPKL